MQRPGDSVCEVSVKYRAIIKQSDGWWIGWLVDLPGVNGQERTRTELIESLQIGAEDMLASEITVDVDSTMIVVDVPAPAWMPASA